VGPPPREIPPSNLGGSGDLGTGIAPIELPSDNSESALRESGSDEPEGNDERSYMTLDQAFYGSIQERIAGNRKHGWTVEDSMAVAKALHKSETGDDMDAKHAEKLQLLINPSQFRQVLEKSGLLDPAPVKLRGEAARIAEEINKLTLPATPEAAK